MERQERWIDVSVPLRPGMIHWPGNTPVTIERDQEPGGVSVSSLGLGAHTGTHMDAPVHFLPGAAGMEALPLEAVIGPARVVAVDTEGAIEPRDLDAHDIGAGERLLFRTRNSARAWWTREFSKTYAHLSTRAAKQLVACGVAAVGVDYLSVGGFGSEGRETHVELLQAGIWIIEGLNLSAVEPGWYDLICLPLSIPGADGAPARAVVRRRVGRS